VPKRVGGLHRREGGVRSMQAALDVCAVAAVTWASRSLFRTLRLVQGQHAGLRDQRAGQRGSVCGAGGGGAGGCHGSMRARERGDDVLGRGQGRGSLTWVSRELRPSGGERRRASAIAA